MAYKNNGYQRSLTFVVKRIVDGVVQSTTKYNGCLAFGSYGEIDDKQLARMPYEDYQQRLKDFIAYVESTVSGLDVEAALEPGSAPRRYNTSSCPIGGSSSGDSGEGGGSGEGGDSGEGGGSGEGGDPDDSTNPEETIVITGLDSLTEGDTAPYSATPYPTSGWSIESGAMGSDVINVATGVLTTDGNVGQTRTLVIKAKRGTIVGRKEVKVYAKDSGTGEETLTISGPDEINEGDVVQYTSMPAASRWSIVSGALNGDGISETSGQLITIIAGQERTLKIKAESDDKFGTKEVLVKAATIGNI